MVKSFFLRIFVPEFAHEAALSLMVLQMNGAVRPGASGEGAMKEKTSIQKKHRHNESKTD
jgi:hypothetical protein